MRVVHVASGDLWAGAEASVYELCRELHHRSVDVSAIIMNPGKLAAKLRTTGIRTIVLDESRQSSFRLLGIMRSSIAALRPHVVHSHRVKENILATLASRLVWPAPALVKTIHGAGEYTALRWSRSGIALAADRVLDRLFDARVAVSIDLLGILLSTAPTRRFVMIHNGIRPPHSSIMPATMPTQRIVGFAGRLVPVKRVDLVLRTAAELRARSTEPVRFEIAGDGPLRPELTAMAERLGIADNVEFLGFRDDPWGLLSRWNALLLTSDHEGLPMICLEALAAGVPIVARDVGGLHEIIRQPAQGILVGSDAPEVLADALQAALASRAPGSARKPLLESRFTADAMTDGYLTLYERLTGSG